MYDTIASPTFLLLYVGFLFYIFFSIWFCILKFEFEPPASDFFVSRLQVFIKGFLSLPSGNLT